MDSDLLKSTYKVFPQEPKRVVITEKDIPSSNGSALGEFADLVPGCVWFALLIILVLPIAYVVQATFVILHVDYFIPFETTRGFPLGPLLVWGTSFAIFFTGAYFLFTRIGRVTTRKKIAKLQSEANERAVEESVQEAARVTNRLQGILNDAAYCETKLTQALNDAHSFVMLSRREYDENVPGPFWDAVEDCAYRLADANSLAQQLSNHASTYYSLLDGRNHTFPPFPVDFVNLPDPSTVIDDLFVIVRRGQTAVPNPHFYKVWEDRKEHRLTRQVMIQEFATLRDAINNLGRVLNQSIVGLRAAVTSGIGQLGDENAATRKIIDERAREQTKMLDNIQRGHKPLL